MPRIYLVNSRNDAKTLTMQKNQPPKNPIDCHALHLKCNARNDGFTHPLTPSAREGESKPKKTNHKTQKPTHYKKSLHYKKTKKSIDCHEFANANSRNDANPQPPKKPHRLPRVA
ncbi:hypothetical protein [Helicobacter sp. T3_23-1056]